MRIRESGMPEESMWSQFFDPVRILKTMGLNSKVKDIADFGCGYGTFAIPAAKLVSGKVYAIDIDPEMIDMVKNKVLNAGIDNVETRIRDLLDEGSGLENESVDCVLLFNLLHTKHARALLDEAYRVLRTNGHLAIVNWNLDPTTPRGPPMEMRPSLKQSVDWCIDSGFKSNSKKVYDFEPHHYGLVMKK